MTTKKVERFDFRWPLRKSVIGDYVAYVDYAKLLAERDALRELCKDLLQGCRYALDRKVLRELESRVRELSGGVKP